MVAAGEFAQKTDTDDQRGEDCGTGSANRRGSLRKKATRLSMGVLARTAPMSSYPLKRIKALLEDTKFTIEESQVADVRLLAV